MYYDIELDFLRKTLEKCRLQTVVINPDEALDDNADMGLRKIFGGEEKRSFYDAFPEARPYTVYHVTDIFNCCYIFLQLPDTEKERFFLIGPYLNIAITEQDILEKGEKLGLSPRLSKELGTYYATIPMLRDESFIFALVNTFAEFLWNGADNYYNVEINRGYKAAFSDDFQPFFADVPEDLDKSAQMEERYKFENELINAISHGNSRKAEEMISTISSVAFESRIPDQLRSIKNYCIIMNTLFRKAAENGGVHPVHLNRVSSEFAIKIEEIRSVVEAYSFMKEILRSYCRLVKRNSVKDYSPIVQKTIIRIESDITADLSLKELSKQSNVSPNYFSALFRKETGTTLTEYVNRKRMENAKRLLRNTALQVQTVAQHCGILDFHYFCRMFKRHTGMTPREYRQNFLID